MMRSESTALGRMGSRVSRDTGVYVAGSLITLAVAVAQVAILTRLLSPDEFGELAVLSVFSTLLTVVFNLASLQGSLIFVYGASGEEELDDSRAAQMAKDKKGGLGTGIALTAVVSLGLGGAVCIASRPIADLLLGSGDEWEGVVWAAVAGGFGAVWRLATNALRLERRPGSYVLNAALRPLAMLAATTTLVATGYGVAGAVAGMGVGSGLGALAAVVAIRKSFRRRFSVSESRRIMRLGAALVPVVGAFWLIQNADLLLLSRFASDADVGAYRVASRIAAVTSYLVSAFFMAWAPLSREPLQEALNRERGRARAGSLVFTHLAFAGAWLMVGMVLFADELIRVASDSFAGAAELIPLLAAGFVANGVFLALQRVAQFPDKRQTYIVLTVVAAVAFIGASLLLIPPYGGTGAAAAILVGYGVAIVAMLVLDLTRGEATHYEWGRILAATGLAAAWAAAGLALAEQAPGKGAEVGVKAGFVVAYPLLLLATGVLPVHRAVGIGQIVLGALPGGSATRRSLEQGLVELDPKDRLLVELLVVKGRPPQEAAHRIGGTEDEALERLTLCLRGLAGIEGPAIAPEHVGRFLVSTDPPAERDAQSRALWNDRGVPPMELDTLSTAAAALRRSGRLRRS